MTEVPAVVGQLADGLAGLGRVGHPRWWLHPVMADLGLTSMARGRQALAQASS